MSEEFLKNPAGSLACSRHLHRIKCLACRIRKRSARSLRGLPQDHRADGAATGRRVRVRASADEFE